MSIPAITLPDGGPDVAAISDKDGFEDSHWRWYSDVALLDYEVMVVGAAFETHDQGILIPTAEGSLNITGGPVAAEEEVVSLVKGGDLKAVAPDGLVTVKVFGRSLDTEEWSGG